MKRIKHFAFILAGIFFMAACQKELSVETGSIGGLAQGTLKDSLGDCQPIMLNGIYFADSTLTDSNYVIVQVNVTVPGSYKITTDVQNGYSFKDSGYITTAGLLSIKLKASGRPLQPISSDFTVSFGNSFCLFSVPVVPKAMGNPAVFSLSGTASNCTNAVIQGTYTAGTALNASNTVNIQVNVTTVGSYTITTSTVNGMTFFKTGNFTSTGLQIVTLAALGTPTVSGANTVPVTAGSSNCSFTVNVLPAAVVDINFSDTAWKFTQGSRTFNGTLDSVVFSKVNGTFDVLQLYGLTQVTGDSLFAMALVMTSTTIQSGTYTTNAFAVFNFSDINSMDIYKANPSTTTPPVNVTVILNYDPVTKIARGTFSGTAQNASNASVPITQGSFTAKVP